MLLLKTDASGNFAWQQTYGRNGIDIGYEIIKSVDAIGYIITGKVFTTSDDNYLLKLDEKGLITGIDPQNSIDEGIIATIYPNPTTSTFFIRYDFGNKDGTYRLLINDYTGRTLKNKILSYPKGEIEMDLHDLAAGIYACTITNNSRTIYSSKLIIQ